MSSKKHGLPSLSNGNGTRIHQLQDGYDNNDIITTTPIKNKKRREERSEATITNEEQFSTTNTPSASGIPVIELVNKLVSEKVLNVNDKIAVTEAIKNPVRKDRILKSLSDIELGTNRTFSVKKLKALLHQNVASSHDSLESFLQKATLTPLTVTVSQKFGSMSPIKLTPKSNRVQLSSIKDQSGFKGNSDETVEEVNPRHMSNQVTPKSTRQSSFKDKDKPSPTSNSKRKPITSTSKIVTDEPAPIEQTVATIEKVFGNSPLYSSPDNFNVCQKISQRLAELLAKAPAASVANIKFAVLIGTGSMNPLTRMHMRTFFLAKQYLEHHANFYVLGSLLSPAHGVTVRERYRTNSTEIIPSPHRLAIAQMMVENSKWLTIDPWEITRRRTMDYLALLQHVAEIMKIQLPTVEIKVFYVCKSNMIPIISPQALRAESFGGVVCVCRPYDCDLLRNSLTKKWNGLIWVVEDGAMLDSGMDMVSSRKVRDKIKKGEPVDQLVGRKIQEYILTHRLCEKMLGEEEWEKAEKSLPQIASKPFIPLASNELMRDKADRDRESVANVANIGNVDNESVIGSLSSI